MSTVGFDDIELLDAIPMAVVVVDPEQRIVGWNRAAEVLYGHPAHDVVGFDVLEKIFDPADRARARTLFAGAAGGITWDGDFRVRRRDGVLLVSSFRCAPVGELGVGWIVTDSADQGLAEQERSELLLAERAARSTAEEALGLVEAILTAAPVGIAVFDMDLRYVRVNSAYADISGLAPEEHVGGRLGDVVPVSADLAADLRRVATTGRTILGRPVDLNDPVRREVRHFTMSYFPVRTATGAVIGAGLTAVEVTAARRAEAERALLLRRAEDAHARLAVLATASTVLTTTMELDELLGRLSRVLTPSAADWCVIALVDASDAVVEVGASGTDRSEASRVAASLTRDGLGADRAKPMLDTLRSGQARLVRGPILDLPVDASVVVPVQAHGRATGVLVLAAEEGRALGEDDLDLAVEVAHRAALAVSNAMAYAQEHHIAASLQRALLPARVPGVAGLDLAVRYVAATDGASIGGDWYDVLAFDDGSTGLVVGDVLGHDIAASTSMGQLRTALRVYACEAPSSPGAALARVDRIHDQLGLAHATCIFGVLDAPASTFRWSNAGHPPPLLVRDGEPRFLEDGTGTLLGVTGGTDPHESVVDMRPDDLLVLYTDGLVERRGENLTTGLARLAAAAREHADAHVELLADALLEALVPAAGTREDDVAILVARLRSDAVTPGVHRLPFDPVPESASLTRGYVAGVLGAAGLGSHLDTAVLLVSELVTNAIRHATAPCALVISVGPESVEVAVEDGHVELPRQGEPADDGPPEGGLGLLLVSALADDWGVRPLAQGKAVWFVLRVSPS